jgi:CBS domain-containing protein
MKIEVRIMPFNIGDYMEKSFLIAGFETTVREASSMIADSVHELVVVMERGIPKGFVTVGDIVTKVISIGSDPSKLTLMEIMTSSYKVVDPEEDLMHAWDLIKGGAQLLVVVKNGIVYGIVTPNTLAMRFGDYANSVTKGILRNTIFYK